MSAVPVFAAFLTDEGLVFDAHQQDDRRRWLRALAARGAHQVDVTYRAHKAQRSADQNAYWWSVPVALVAEHTGFTPEQAHYALLGEYGGYEEGPLGKPVPRITSSAKLKTDEFSKLIEWVLEWGPEHLGVFIPEPGAVEAA